MSGFPDIDPGTVWLVGAGPGDPGLLTLLAHHALSQADVVIHDALVGSGVLDMIPASAQRIAMGKRAGRTSPVQETISALMIEHAQAGKRVVRLKGGDPFVFARGAEEALALAEAGIAFRIVPGVTAGIGGLAMAGIPLTSKQISSVAMATGHGPDGSLDPKLDVEGLGRSADMLVFYMAIETLPELTDRLLKSGRDPQTPAAIVSHASLPDQQVLTSCLGELREAVKRAKPPTPALLVIGANVALRERLTA
ncbi:Uroporphyrinogen-III C-methyltransferase [Rhodospirillaceae bacterium LM-1]|nr:Uroporphyrinogen-III C-methyltransferase [Rhodospirillaceae bacterium LM-1]